MICPLPKSVHDEYIFGKELGKGAYGTVVSAQKRKCTTEIVAIKIVKRKDMTPEDEEDLKLEVEILKTLHHEYVMSLIAYYKEPDAHYIVTEVLEGGELFDRIEKKKQYNEKEARDVMYIFFKAMEYIHENGILHRDLKPENLLLKSKTDDEHFKIADFGLAGKISKGKGTLTGVAGTPLYMSPEMVSKKPYSFPSDVWSMGVICFILLGGYPPFHGQTMGALLTKIKKADYHFEPKFWDHVSPTAKELIGKMLELNPDKRITVKQALAHEWIKDSNEARLLSKDLSVNHVEFVKFNAKRKFRAAVDAVYLLNTLQHKGHHHEIDKHHAENPHH